MKSRGFTLIEVLVAVALMAMLGIILATSMSSIIGAIKDSKQMQDYYHTARVALGRMQQEISMAYISKHQSELRSTKTVFIGKQQSLTFTYMGHRRMVRNARESDEGFVEYKVEHDSKTNDNVLVRREKTIIDDAPQKGGQRQVLATGVQKVQFQYWDMDKESWTSDWKVEIDRVQEELAHKAATAAAVTGATGNAALGKALAGQKPIAPTHTAEDHWLPARVKIILTIKTDDGDMQFETQARVRLQEALDFNGVYTPKAYENSLNPYAAVPATTPSNFAVPGSAATQNPNAPRGPTR